MNSTGVDRRPVRGTVETNTHHFGHSAFGRKRIAGPKKRGLIQSRLGPGTFVSRVGATAPPAHASVRCGGKPLGTS
jgi:hypothetical protein